MATAIVLSAARVTYGHEGSERLTVRVAGQYAGIPAGKVTVGLSPNLNEAMTAALDAMITWMTQLLTVDRSTALALASVAVSLRVTQVVNGTWGVHALLPDGALG